MDRVADGGFAVSQGLRDFFVEAGISRAERLGVVRHGISFDRVTYATAPNAHRRSARQLVLTGRLVPVKNHASGLEAFAILRRRGMEAALTVVGGGPLEAQLRQRASELGIANAVHFVGYQPNPHDFYRDADVALVPSRGEGFGLVILEAWHHSLPVVAFRTRPFDEIIAPGVDGELATPFDPSSLATSLESILAAPDKAKAMGAAGNRKVQKEYALERMVDETLAFYAAVVEGRANVSFDKPARSGEVADAGSARSFRPNRAGTKYGR
jgi:glycosyltransferase involved in cell wall biosynthesis